MAMTESAAQLSAPIKKDADTLQQYGALAWRRSKRGEVKVLLITSRERKRWIVPKGWPIKGKTPARTAAREAFEEAGVIGDAQAEAIGAYNYVKICATERKPIATSCCSALKSGARFSTGPSAPNASGNG